MRVLFRSAGTAALGRRKAYAHRAFGRFGHQLANPFGGVRSHVQGGRSGAGRGAHHSIPSSSFASSDIFCGSPGGSHTRLTSAWPTPGPAPTRNSTSPGMVSGTGQGGVASDIDIGRAAGRDKWYKNGT